MQSESKSEMRSFFTLTFTLILTYIAKLVNAIMITKGNVLLYLNRILFNVFLVLILINCEAKQKILSKYLLF